LRQTRGNGPRPLAPRQYLASLHQQRFMTEVNPKLTCRVSEPSRLAAREPKLSGAPPLPLLVVFGLQYGPLRYGGSVGETVRKPLRVTEFERVLGFFDARDYVLPLPAPELGKCECPCERNVVFEFWTVQGDVDEAVRRSAALAYPDNYYITSVYELVRELKTLVEGADRARIYILSKYANPGYISWFIEELSSDTVELYVAVESRHVSGRVEESERVTLVATRSHRKAVLAYAEVGDRVVVAGFWGSMNVFYPGVDDFMVSVNDVRDLQVLLHGILRAFLAV